MAINAATQWECQVGGDDNNGGGFNPNASGTDYSQQTTAQATTTTATVVNATTSRIDVDSGDYTCTDADIGNIIQIYGGTATAGFYEITGRSGQQWFLDRAVGTAGQTVVAKMGGCFGSPGGMSAATTNGAGYYNKFWLKSGTYTLTNATGRTSGGPWVSDLLNAIVLEGYRDVRGDLAEAPVLKAGSQTNLILFHHDRANQMTFTNVKADGESQTGVNGFDADYSGTRFNLCEAINCDAATTNYGFQTGKAYRCKATNCGEGFDTLTNADSCIATGCNTGFINTTTVSNSLAFDCVNGISGAQLGMVTNCTVDNCTGIGVIGNGLYLYLTGTIISNCGQGYDSPSSQEHLIRVAFFNNTSDGDTGEIDFDTFSLTVDPYVDSYNDDYRLNESTGGGAECVVTLGTDGTATVIGALPQVTTPPATRHPLGRF